MRIILAQDPNLRHQDRQNSRNDLVVYSSNTGGPSLHRDEFANDLLNQIKVKDYIQMNKLDNQPITASSVTHKKTFEKLSPDDVTSNIPNELNDFNFYTPNNQQNYVNNSISNKLYLVNKHPLSGSAGYPRGLDNDPSLCFRKKSKSRIDDSTNPGYSSRLNSCNYNRQSNVNKSSSFRNLKYSHRSNSNSRKQYLSNCEKSGSKRTQKTKSALSTYMAYKQSMSKKKTKKKSKKKLANQSNVNYFNHKKNSVDSVGNSINGPYLSPFFSSRDGRPSTSLKSSEPNMQLDMNSAISLLQYNNMVTVDSIKSKKAKSIIPLKDRITQKQPKRKSSNRNTKDELSSVGNRVSDAYMKDRASFVQLKHLNSNNSFGPEAYFASDLVQRNKVGGNFFTEGAPSVNESHSKDYNKSRNSKVMPQKSYNKIYSTNPQKSPGKLTNRK